MYFILLLAFNASVMAHMVKNLPAMQETGVPSLGWEDPLEEAWQPTPVFLPGESHGQRSSAGYSPWGRKRTGHACAHVHAGTCPYCTPFSCVFLSRALPQNAACSKSLVGFTVSFLAVFLVLLNLVP